MGEKIALETAQAFWSLLLPHGLPGGALTRCNSEDTRPIGWKAEFTELWFTFLNKKGGKGVSKDTWAMVSFLFGVGRWEIEGGRTSERGKYEEED